MTAHDDLADPATAPHVGRLLHHALSAASQRVRLALAIKGLRFDSEPIDLRGQQHTPEYRALNAAGVVPTLIREGEVLVESSAILEYLDEEFPEPALRPHAALGRQRMRAWLRRLEDTSHPAIGFLTYAVAVRPSLSSSEMARMPEMIAAMPNSRARALRNAALFEGTAAPEFADAVRAEAALLDAMAAALARGPYLLGDALSLVDLTALPDISRLDQLGWAAALIGERAPLADWFTRMQRSAAHQEAITRWMPQAVAENWRALGQQAWPAAQAVLAR